VALVDQRTSCARVTQAHDVIGGRDEVELVPARENGAGKRSS
jgi:hypothetical protein